MDSYGGDAHQYGCGPVVERMEPMFGRRRRDSGCHNQRLVIQAGQGSPKQLATALNNRGVVYKFKGEYDRALEDYNQAILLNPS